MLRSTNRALRKDSILLLRLTINLQMVKFYYISYIKSHSLKRFVAHAT